MTKSKEEILYDAVAKIAAFSDYPPPPAQFLTMQKQWQRMISIARTAKAQADAVRTK